MKPQVLCIAGPTAVGKTSIAIEVAKQLNGEIISADSRQIYKELNIGVAKPTEDELRTIPHHLISIISIQDDYTAKQFQIDATDAINGILSRNKVPIIVGGTGLYIDALLYGLDDLPSISQNVREKISLLIETEPIEVIQEKVKNIDPKGYEMIDIYNPRRLQRILEIWEEKKLIYSELLGKNKKGTIDYDIKSFVLTMDRAKLYDRINKRVDNMVLLGLKNETEQLYPYKHLQALQTVGYSEYFDFFDGKTDEATAIDKIKQHSRNYAKRQITWNKKHLPEAITIAMDSEENPVNIIIDCL